MIETNRKNRNEKSRKISKDKCANFFYYTVERSNMTHDMDRICCTIIVAAAVVMLCMGYVEMMKMKSHYQTSTCGMKTVVPTQLSAKIVENDTIPQKTKETHEFLNIDEEWPIEESECKHEEFKQLSDVLDKDFGNFLEDLSKTEKHKVSRKYSSKLCKIKHQTFS